MPQCLRMPTASARPNASVRRTPGYQREGNTSRQIGSTLFISPRTVEMHVQSSMQKLRRRTRAEAVRRLADLGAVPQR